MSRRKLLSIASAVIMASGGMLFTTPAQASSEAFDCRASVRAYCQVVADTYCTGGAICTYDTTTCYITNTQCSN